MQRTVNVHINGQSFFMDEDAHVRLDSYLKKLQHRYGQTEGGAEIIADIEGRLAELFLQKTNPSVGVVTLQMVEESILIMGEPEQFDDGQPTNSSGDTAGAAYQPKAPKRLYRDPDNRVLGGVCAGFSAYFGADVTLVRILMVLVTILSGFTVAFVYLLLWVILPEAVLPSQKLEMRGENINVENIEKAVKQEFEAVKESFSKMEQSEAFQNSKRYFDRLNQRDRTVLIIVGVVLAVWVIGRLIHIPFIPFFAFSFGNWHWPVLGIGFFLPVIVVMLGIGLVYKSLLKPMLWIVAILMVLGLLSGLFWPLFNFVHHVAW